MDSNVLCCEACRNAQELTHLKTIAGVGHWRCKCGHVTAVPLIVKAARTSPMEPGR